MNVKPATPAVSAALGYTHTSPRFVETSCLPIEGVDPVRSATRPSIDAIAYIGQHSLKNSALTIQVMNNLASRGHKIILIGQETSDAQIHENVEHHKFLDHDTLLSYMKSSILCISLSIEQGGFFSFEAAASGCLVLCFPDSGAARLPRAILLASETEYASVDLIVKRCQAAIKIARATPTMRGEIIFETWKMQKDATDFFYKNF